MVHDVNPYSQLEGMCMAAWQGGAARERRRRRRNGRRGGELRPLLPTCCRCV